MKNNILVEIWGTYPPPYGGVSIHVMRLFWGLKKYDDLDVSLINLKSTFEKQEEKIYKGTCVFCEFIKLLLKTKRIIHLHVINPFFWYIITIFATRHHLFLTLHGQNLKKKRPLLIEIMIKRTLHRMDCIFLNDPDYRNFLIESYHLEDKKLKLVPAFIPPMEIERKGVPNFVIEFRNRKKYIISANAWKIYKRDGEDIYGILTLLKLINILKKEGLDVGLIFCYAQYEKHFYNEILQKIKDFKLEEDVILVNMDKGNAFEIWEISDLFVRPTSYDIEGFSIKEALYFGVPAIASDVCLRPKEAVTYRFDDFEDLVKKVRKILMQKKKDISLEFENVPEILHENYLNLCKGHKDK